jgi:hypothetical protein
MDGICGLGFSGLARITKPTILELMKISSPNIPAVFSLFLSSLPNDDLTSQRSVIIFGGYDLTLVSNNASFIYTPVIQMGSSLSYWIISIVGMSIIKPSHFNIENTKSISIATFCSKK